MCHTEESAADISVTNSQRRTDCLPRDMCAAGQSINIGKLVYIRVCSHYTEDPSDDIRSNATVVEAKPYKQTRKHI
uniref:Uncharacterized protein n=1 Tax=Panagrellus redivivus TaxID=6233 RepID=A0A7E4ZYQ7_PANRE